MNDKYNIIIRSVERYNLCIAGLFLSVSLIFWSIENTFGIFLGFLIVTINFKWLQRIIKAYLEKKGLKIKIIISFILKLGFLFGSITVIFFYTRINILAIFIGTTTILFAALIQSIINLIKK